MTDLLRQGSLAALLVTGLMAALPARSAPPVLSDPAGAPIAAVSDPAAPSAEAFDAAFANALREGMGITPAEGRAAVAALQAALPEGDDLRKRRFLAMSCSAPRRDRQAGRAEAEARLAAESALESPDRTSLALLHSCTTVFLPTTSAIRRLLSANDAAVREAAASGNRLLHGQMLAQRSSTYSLGGQFARSLVDALEAQKQFEASGEALAIAVNRQNVGIAYRRMGELQRAEEYLQRSLQEPDIQSRWSYQLVGLLQLGFLYDETARYTDARRVLEEAITLCRENDSVSDCGYTRLALAGVEVNDGAAERALALLTRSEADFELAGDPGDPTMVAMIRAKAKAQQGEMREALTLLDGVIETWTAEENDRYLALALPERALVLEGLGRHADAVIDLRRFIEAHARDDRQRAEQRTDFMREQFDASQREIENAELKAREALRIQEIEGLNAAKRWQWTALGLGGVLLLVMLGLILRQLVKARRLRLLAMTDPLTGLANRRHTDYRGTLDFKAARKNAHSFCVLAIDIDHFKQVNDMHGHAIGDVVLQRVGRECQRTLRKLDLMGRIGGEEFTGLLPETDEVAAYHVAERLRCGVETLDLDDVVPGLKVTISIGVAQMRDTDTDFAGLLSRADAAMYRAKQSGRNRVVSDETD